jgi:hypothetical protein
MTSWERNATGIGLGVVVWIIAAYGQPPGSLGWGRLIVLASATLSVLVCGACLTDNTRRQRANIPGASPLHGLLVTCAAPLLGIHLLRAFGAIYLSSGPGWFIVDAAIVGLSAGQSLLLIVVWPTLLPPPIELEQQPDTRVAVASEPAFFARQHSRGPQNPTARPNQTPRSQVSIPSAGSISADAQSKSTNAPARTFGKIAFGIGAIALVGVGITAVVWLSGPGTPAPALACVQPDSQTATAMPAAQASVPTAQEEPVANVGEMSQPPARKDGEAATAVSEARPSRNNRSRAPPRRVSP